MSLGGGQATEIRERLKWLMALRVVIVTLLLGTLIVLQIGEDKGLHHNPLFSSLIAGTYLLTIIYSLLINRVRNLKGLAYVQFLNDILLQTILVHYTGGIDSPFSPLYMITILSGSVILDRRGGVLTGALAGISYGLIVDIQYFALLPGSEPTHYGGSETFYILFLNILAFVTVAYLAGGLTENLKEARQRLMEKTAGLADLIAFHENVVQSISSGLLTTDTEGMITSLNRAASEITGYTEEEVRARPCWELFGSQDIKGLIARVPSMSGPLRINRECKRKNGTPLQLGMTVSPLSTRNGEVTGRVWAFQDLTRIKEMEEEVKRKKWLAMIGEMAAGMAHEVRNPLASISGTMQVMKNDNNLSPDNKYLMEIGVKETDRLNSIITSFLRYTRPAPLNRKPCDLHEFLKETMDLLKGSQDYQHLVKIEARFSNENLQVNIDRDQIKQVFWNLALNAIQAMPEGGVLEISTHRVVPKRKSDNIAPVEHPWILIAFKDTGKGIPKDQREKIFYPFFTTKNKGSGLGLSIVHRIIEDHGGRVHVDSEAGKGTTMNIFIPADEEKVPIGKAGFEGRADA